MRFQTLEQWLAWQESLHPREIELGLERVREVLGRMGIAVRCPVITVGGTNGKGSFVAMLEAVLRAEGYRVGAYTSPHLIRYNERVRVDGREASDQALCEAFATVDAARGDAPLTYFEFGTLAAIDRFVRDRVDVALLEVGMGGRLDAVNVLDADAAVVTTVDVDHTAWLGEDRDAIGREKAGIYRPARPALYADRDAPDGLVEAAAEAGVRPTLLGRDYDYRVENGRWSWWGRGASIDGLPLPAGTAAPWCLKCAAGVLAALDPLRDRLPVSRSSFEEGLSAARLPGRFQVVPGTVTEIFDVAHNPQAARELAAGLAAEPCTGRTLAVFAALADKDVAAVTAAVADRVDRWHVAGLDRPRGAGAAEIAAKLPQGAAVQRHPTVSAALAAARSLARPGDRIVVFGSFHTVAEALQETL